MLSFRLRHALSRHAGLCWSLIALFLALFVVSPVPALAQTIAFVQSNYATPQAPQITVTVPFTAAQSAGNLSVVVVGWNDSTAHVVSVSDTNGNVYLPAVGPTVQAGLATQTIYYAKNIAAAATAGSNAVTVTFDSPAQFPDIRIAEYRGLDTVSPLDVSAGAQGNSATSNSGAVTTTNPNDLLVGANVVQTGTAGAGTGFTNRVITVPDGDILEDRVVTATGSYSATAAVSPAGAWIMQIVAFRAAGSAPPDTTPPTAPSSLTATPASVSQINLSWTASTDNVGVTGYLVERCQGSGCTNFVQVTTTTGTTYNDTGLQISTSYSYQVRAKDAANNLSPYSNIASATTQADTTPPTAPSSLTATAASASQINLSWTASTDNVGVTGYRIERCQGSGCSNFVQIATTTTATTYNDTGLTSGTTYNYQVRAADAANNLSAYSNVASATTQTPDTQPPTAPGNLTANAVSSSQINLSWTASTDNVGVTGYLIERCQGAGCANFAQITTSTGTTYSNTGLASGTTYSYRLRATDAANNLSTYSNAASATTQAAPQIAFKQMNYAVPAGQQTSLALPFTAAQTAGNLNVVVVGWNDSTTHVASLTDTMGNAYVLAVGPTVQTGTATQSIYYAKNIAAAAANGNTVTVTFDASAKSVDVRIAEYSGLDQVNPLDVVAAAQGNSTTSNSGAVTTTTANDLLVGANLVQTGTTGAGTGFTSRVITPKDGDILEDGVVTATGSYSATAPVSPSGAWIMQMVAFRAAGTGGPDTQAPSAPSALTATAVSTSQINLSWTASTDNVGVTAYLIERCQGSGCTNFAQLPNTATATTFSDTGLAASTTYTYRVRATDAANNLSFYSNTAAATTQTPDTQPPTAPANLTATAVSASQINLSWTASTDNVGVTGYLVERCQGTGCTNFLQVATPTSTSYNDAGLAASTTYVYRVRAKDAANNLGQYSNTASDTTQAPDTQPPTAPTNLGATAVSASQINLSWTASTDNVGVTAYLIERCQGTGCTFAQVATTANTNYTDGGLNANTAYSYRVRATDAANNLSGYSNVASATTQAGSASITYVQGNYATPQSAQSVGVSYTGAQAPGNLNVVVVGWNDSTSHVQSVTDTKGNTYVLAVGPTVQAGLASQSVYYATGIAAANPNANTVTVAFSGSANAPDIRIAEYNGIDPTNPVDAVAATQGSGSTSNSGALTTTNPNDLLFAANLVQTGTSGPGAGFTKRVITVPDSDIVEDQFVTSSGIYSATAPLTSVGSWIMQMVAFRGFGVPPPPDTTPPTVTITAPSAGSNVGGTITLSANATDNVTALGVQFQVDGVSVGPPQTSAPYSISFDTSTFTNGTHSISAYAWDPARNLGNSSPVSVTFSNASPSNPAQVGLWSGGINWPMVAINANALPNGKVLMWDQMGIGLPDPQVWDPLTGIFVTVPTNDTANLFCSGQAPLGDGRVLVAGGHIATHVGLAVGRIFNGANNQWTDTPDMSFGRWYPTVTTLPDGRVIVIAGESTCADCDVTIPEIYNSSTNIWTKLNNASLALPYYPHVFVLSNGKLLVAGTSEDPVATRLLDLNTQAWSTVDSRQFDAASSVMYLPDKILKTGTSSNPDFSASASSATAYVLDMTAPSPSWRQVTSMAFPRAYENLTVLPDGTVLVSGGGTTTGALDFPNAVFQAEIWSPTTETWTTLSSMHVERLYHSIALLLPDGRVLTAGGGRFFGAPDPTDRPSAEIFAPPYLFKGPRPMIGSAPSQLTYAQAFTVQTPDASRIAKVSLIRLGNVTHAFNMNQRYIPLNFAVGTGSLNVSAPANANQAPPGYYMLFLVDTNGVPSVATIVRF